MNHQTNQHQFNPLTYRRTFLKGFAGSAAALSVFPALAPAGSTNELLRVAENLTAADAANESF